MSSKTVNCFIWINFKVFSDQVFSAFTTEQKNEFIFWFFYIYIQEMHCCQHIYPQSQIVWQLKDKLFFLLNSWLMRVIYYFFKNLYCEYFMLNCNKNKGRICAKCLLCITLAAPSSNWRLYVCKHIFFPKWCFLIDWNPKY